MNFKTIFKPLFWVPIFIFIGVIFLLVHFESRNPESSIKTFADGLWFAVVTLTTVGYGDMYPVTALGKIIGLIIILSSLGLLGYLIGNISSKINRYMEKKRQGFYGVDFENHFIILGWNSFGNMVAEQIVKTQNKISIVTDNKDDLDFIRQTYDKSNVSTLYTDYSNFEFLEKINIEKSSSVFVNMENDTKSLVYIINLKKIYPNLNFVVSLDNADLKETFYAIDGVRYAISKNEIASKLVASYIFEPDVAHITEDLMSTSVNEQDYDVQEYLVLETNPFLGKEYLDVFINLKKEYNCILLGLSKFVDGKYIIMKDVPDNTKIALNDYILLISNGGVKQRLEDSFGVREGRTMRS